VSILTTSSTAVEDDLLLWAHEHKNERTTAMRFIDSDCDDNDDDTPSSPSSARHAINASLKASAASVGDPKSDDEKDEDDEVIHDAPKGEGDNPRRIAVGEDEDAAEAEFDPRNGHA